MSRSKHAARCVGGICITHVYGTCASRMCITHVITHVYHAPSKGGRRQTSLLRKSRVFSFFRGRSALISRSDMRLSRRSKTLRLGAEAAMSVGSAERRLKPRSTSARRVEFGRGGGCTSLFSLQSRRTKSERLMMLLGMRSSLLCPTSNCQKARTEGRGVRQGEGRRGRGRGRDHVRGFCWEHLSVTHSHLFTHAHMHAGRHAYTHARKHTRTHARTHARPHARTHTNTRTDIPR